jgi:Uma2 family endonuclease
MLSTAIALPPLLHEGDRLDSREFLRRWEAMPGLKQAELIDGIVYMPSPVGLFHAEAENVMNAWLWLYKDATPGCGAGGEATWKMGPDEVPQPDLFLRILPECGGQSSDAGGYCSGAPELVVEISGASFSRDLGVKLELYRRAGVREYLSVLLNPRQIIWRELSRGRYREIKPEEDGLLRSRVFPGLWLDPDAVFSARKSIRKAVERGIASTEHAAFVRRLAVARKRK